MAGLRDADAGARQVGFEDGRRGVSRSVGHRPGIQHQGSAATRKSRAVAAPRSARFPREQLSVQVTELRNLGLVGRFWFFLALPVSLRRSMRQILEPRAHHPSREKKPQVEALLLSGLVNIFRICRILPFRDHIWLEFIPSGVVESSLSVEVCIKIATLNL